MTLSKKASTDGLRPARRRERPSVLALGVGPVGAHADVAESGGERLLGRLAEQRRIDGGGRGVALLQDVADALVGGGERRRLGQREELAHREQSAGDVVQRRAQADHRVDGARVVGGGELLEIALVDEGLDLDDGVGGERYGEGRRHLVEQVAQDERAARRRRRRGGTNRSASARAGAARTGPCRRSASGRCPRCRPGPRRGRRSPAPRRRGWRRDASPSPRRLTYWSRIAAATSGDSPSWAA